MVENPPNGGDIVSDADSENADEDPLPVLNGFKPKQLCRTSNVSRTQKPLL